MDEEHRRAAAAASVDCNVAAIGCSNLAIHLRGCTSHHVPSKQRAASTHE